MPSLDPMYRRGVVALTSLLLSSACLTLMPISTTAQSEEELKGRSNEWTVTQGNNGIVVDGVNLYGRYLSLSFPIHELKGRGAVSLPLSLRYLSGIQETRNQPNATSQAGWVGLGWGLDVPFIDGQLGAQWDGGELYNITTTYTLSWNGIGDPIDKSTWKLRDRKYWKLQKISGEEEDVFHLDLPP